MVESPGFVNQLRKYAQARILSLAPFYNAAIAQLVERDTRNIEVPVSITGGGSNEIFLIFMVFLLTGCGTIGVRVYDERPKYLYPAVRSEIETIHAICEWDNGWIISLPIIIDLPFTIIGDTVLLPYDYFRWKP